MAFMTRTTDVQMNGGRPVWWLLSLAVSVLAVAVSIVALAGVGWRTGSHDEHFAAALLIFAVFKIRLSEYRYAAHSRLPSRQSGSLLDASAALHRLPQL